MIVGLLNQKGGVGKTTLSVNIAAALTRMGMRTLLIDADPQGSALDWAAVRTAEPLFPVAGMPRASIHKDLPTLAKGYQAVVIDGPPRGYDVIRSAIMASDTVVIPVQPSPYDVWSAKEIIDLLAESAPFKPNIKAAFAVNRKIVNTALGRDVIDALAGYMVPVLRSAVCQRVVMAESAASGRTVFEVAEESPASTEIMALVHELVELKGQGA